MSVPREVLPGRVYMITRRCTQRQFLMRPDEDTDNAFIYCLAEAANRHGIRVLFTIAMSNHHHTGIHDPEGKFPEFLEHFHKLFAKCQNALRGRWENFWSSEQTSVVRLVDAVWAFPRRPGSPIPPSTLARWVAPALAAGLGPSPALDRPSHRQPWPVG